MPIYEYSCRECGNEFECLVRGNEAPKCPACGKTDLMRKFSVPAAHCASKPAACPAGESCGTSPYCRQNCDINQ